MFCYFFVTLCYIYFLYFYNPANDLLCKQIHILKSTISNRKILRTQNKYLIYKSTRSKLTIHKINKRKSIPKPDSLYNLYPVPGKKKHYAKSDLQAATQRNMTILIAHMRIPRVRKREACWTRASTRSKFELESAPPTGVLT